MDFLKYLFRDMKNSIWALAGPGITTAGVVFLVQGDFIGGITTLGAGLLITLVNIVGSYKAWKRDS